MEFICIGFLGGCLFAAIFLAAGVGVGGLENKKENGNDKGTNKRELAGHNNVYADIPMRDGDRQCDNRYNQSDVDDDEDNITEIIVITALNILRMSTGICTTERRSIDYAIECVKLRHEMEKMIEKYKGEE